jgi:hypothetical protein
MGYIKNTQLSVTFKGHIEIQDNSRIVFSGPFGIGKSTFLNEYFENNSDKYNYIHLYPVNYSIASNEDILALLEYDIIYELLAKSDVKLETETYSDIEILKMVRINNFEELFSPLIECIPKIGKPLAGFLKVLKKYEGLKLQYNAGDKEVIESLMKYMQDKTGSFYKQDAYIEFISKTLDKLKDGEGVKRENILIIDDLDRIDPEHIFRLFNVFAAHFDLNKGHTQNKFGFDKVIFVCDIENIREIFYHRYGVNSNFTGYIDKFYSICIFQVDNKLAIQHYVNKYLPSTHEFTTNLLIDILNRMIETGVLNFRNVKSIIHRYAFKVGTSKYDEQLFFLEIARILVMISGDAESLIRKLENCNKLLIEKGTPSFLNEDNEKVKKYITGILLPAYDYKNMMAHNNQINKQFSLTHFNPSMGGQNFQYRSSEVGVNNNKQIAVIVGSSEETNRALQSLIPYIWKMIIGSIRFLKSEGVI